MTWPATVSAELRVPCLEVGSVSEVEHAIYLHRDGSVTAPDHVESTEQQVLSALGQESQSACHYWLNVPTRRSQPATPPPGREHWRFTYIDLWTTKAAWTALAGIAGQEMPGFVVDPVQALEVLQAFLVAEKVPDDLVQTFGLLAAPTQNERGWRRVEPVRGDEVAALLDAGVPADRVASIAAMGVPADVARVVLRALRKARMPNETLVYLANAVDPTRLPALIENMDHDGLEGLLGRVSILRERLRDGAPYDTEQVFDYLRG